VTEEDKGWSGAKVDSAEEPGTSKRRYVQASLTEANKARNEEKVFFYYCQSASFWWVRGGGCIDLNVDFGASR